VREETGLESDLWWCLESMTTFFDAVDDSIQLLPLFAVELGARDTVRLSPEHVAARFVSAREAAKLYLWEAQRRGLAAVRREVLGARGLAKALALPAPSPRRPARGRKRS
jgi:8-oxo-dGTP pyrophosphatase MutT (NUDIX family)